MTAGPAPTVEQLTRVVALDGPAGSGKTTVAREVARALGWRFVDTGATYRALTLAALLAGIEVEDSEGVLAAAEAATVELSTDPADAWVRLDGADVTAQIRSAAVTANVSAVSAIPAVRALLISLQRSLMGTEGAVVEGRDIASVVAPLAAVKVYLDASPEERARRRAGDQAGVGAPAAPQSAPAAGSGRAAVAQHSAAFELAVAEALKERDAKDNQTNRLEASEGALHLDTTHLTLTEVVDAVVALAAAAGISPSNRPSAP